MYSEGFYAPAYPGEYITRGKECVCNVNGLFYNFWGGRASPTLPKGWSLVPNSNITLWLVGPVLTLVLCVGGILSYRHLVRHAGMSKGKFAAGMAVLLLTLVLALYWLPERGTSDEHIFLEWMDRVSQHGVISVYDAEHSGSLDPNTANDRDYPPFAYVLLDVAAGIGQGLQLGSLGGLKLTLALFVLAGCLVFWAWTGSPGLLLVLAALLLVEGMVYGYLDAFFTPTLLLSLWALQRKHLTVGMTLLLISCLIKWQPLTILPFVLAYIVWQDDTRRLVERIRIREFVTAVLLPAGIVTALLLLWFGITPLQSIEAATENTPLSGQALNLNWILTYLLHWFGGRPWGGLLHEYARIIKTTDWSLTFGPHLLFVISYLLCSLFYMRGPKTFLRLVLYALLGFLSYFVFYTGVHENHLFVPALLGLVLAYLAPHPFRLALALTLLCLVNIRLFYTPAGAQITTGRVLEGVDLSFPMAIAFVLFLALFAVKLLDADRTLQRQRLTAPP